VKILILLMIIMCNNDNIIGNINVCINESNNGINESIINIIINVYYY